MKVTVTVGTQLSKNTTLMGESQQHDVQPNPEVKHAPVDYMKCFITGYDVNHSHTRAQVEWKNVNRTLSPGQIISQNSHIIRAGHVSE